MDIVEQARQEITKRRGREDVLQWVVAFLHDAYDLDAATIYSVDDERFTPISHSGDPYELSGDAFNAAQEAAQEQIPVGIEGHLMFPTADLNILSLVGRDFDESDEDDIEAIVELVETML